MNKQKKICFIVTVSMTIDQFLRWSLEAFKNDGYDITIVSDMDDQFMKTLPEYIHAIPIKMQRGIDLIGMIIATYKMYKLFKQEKFDIIQYSTPNASLYASIASFLSGSPIRLYCQWGLIYVGYKGIKRNIFKFVEKLVCLMSTDIQPDSHGNLYFCREEGLYSEQKSRVVWNGSANGVNLKKFDIHMKAEFRKKIRSMYKIKDEEIVIGFLGRIGKEKGFDELISAFKTLSKKYENLRLLFVGPNEKPETVDQELLKWFEKSRNVSFSGGWVDNTEEYLAAMDIFGFPSYREGFGSVVIEAEAMGIPIIASDIPGPQNALVNGKTGFLIPKCEVQPLVEKLEILILNSEFRIAMGHEAEIFSRNNFDCDILITKIIENRNTLLNTL